VLKASKTGLCLALLAVAAVSWAAPTVRIKDIAYLRGVRGNQLVGIGLLTGLAGRGDSSNSALLQSAIANQVANFGFRIDPQDVRSRNCAVVTVSCEVPAFVRAGETVDVRVSSIGDARSLEGGVLLQTPLKGANGETYALAQGQVFSVGTAAAQRTVGTIPRAAIIERDVLSDFLAASTLAIILRNPDFVTAGAVAAGIRGQFADIELRAVDAAMVEVVIPEGRKTDPVGFIAELEAVQISPDGSNKVVIDAASGVIIFGERVRIGKVAVSYKEVSVDVGAYRSLASGGEQGHQQFTLEETTTVEDLVAALRTIGLETETIINIIKAIDRAGALYGTLVVM
jgi:flagellar P-ring protein precursor FlgI